MPRETRLHGATGGLPEKRAQRLTAQWPPPPPIASRPKGCRRPTPHNPTAATARRPTAQRPPPRPNGPGPARPGPAAPAPHGPLPPSLPVGRAGRGAARRGCRPPRCCCCCCCAGGSTRGPGRAGPGPGWGGPARSSAAGISINFLRLVTLSTLRKDIYIKKYL